jgi:hypothetical protein
MKQLIILSLIALPTLVFAQVDESKLWEEAMHEVSHNGQLAFYSDVVITDSEPFNREDMVAIRHKMYQKEGIFKVELIDHNRIVRVYHYDFIELETIKNFAFEVKREIEVRDRITFEF